MEFSNLLSVGFLEKLTGLVWLIIIIVLGLRSYVFDIIVLMLIAWTAESLIAYGIVPDHIPDIVFIMVICMLFSKIFIRRKPGEQAQFPFLLPYLCFLGVCIISALLNNISALRCTLFLRHLTMFYAFLLSLVNSSLTEFEVKKLNKFMVFIFILQVVVATGKWMFLYDVAGNEFGQEGLTGTYATHGGGFHTLIPLMAMSFIVPAYFATGRKIFIALFWLFGWFVLVGSKRAPVFVMPIMAIYLFRVMKHRFHLDIKFSKVTAMTGAVLVTLLVIISINRTLNPEESMGGSVDVRYILDYFRDYTTSYAELDGKMVATRRFAATEMFFNHLSETDLQTVLFGFGPGSAIRTGLVENNYRTLFLDMGIEGGITGFVWMTTQIGLVGTLMTIWFFVAIYRKIYRVYLRSQSEYWKIFVVGTLGSFIVMAFDFFAYSVAFISSETMLVTAFYFASIALFSEKIEHAPEQDFSPALPGPLRGSVGNNFAYR